MSKKITPAVGIAAAIVAVIAAGVVYLLMTPHSEKTMAPEQAADLPLPIAPGEPHPSVTQPGTSSGEYLDYKDGAITATKGTKLLFFHAPWCPQCRDLDADIKKQGVPSGLTIFKVDYDTSQKLRQKYGVTIQTTVVRID